MPGRARSLRSPALARSAGRRVAGLGRDLLHCTLITLRQQALGGHRPPGRTSEPGPREPLTARLRAYYGQESPQLKT